MLLLMVSSSFTMYEEAGSPKKTITCLEEWG